MSKIITITELDPVHCWIPKDEEVLNALRPVLSYTATYYKPGPFKKTRKEYQKFLMKDYKGGNLFLTGFLPKVSYTLRRAGFGTKIVRPEYNIRYLINFGLNNIKLDPEQIRMVQAALEKGRGVLKAPTGVGKTEMGMAIVNGLRNYQCLWLCHTKDLLSQTAQRLRSEGFKNTGVVGDGSLEIAGKNPIVATRQTIVKHLEPIADVCDAIIVDEVHHVSGFKSEYHDILTNILASIRIGLTATTPPDQTEAQLCVEGLLGPVIDVITLEEAQAMGRLAVPVVRTLKSPLNRSVSDLRRYPDVYEEGVVLNQARHHLIMNKAKEHVDIGDSVLIIVHRITHGEQLEQVARLIGLDCVFIHGNTETGDREEVKQLLTSKKRKCVICTTIWKEGTNIPSLNVIINAAGGKSEIATLQTIGRGLRKTKDKDVVYIYDIFDPSHRFLIAHFGERFSLYCDNGWIK